MSTRSLRPPSGSQHGSVRVRHRMSMSGWWSISSATSATRSTTAIAAGKLGSSTVRRDRVRRRPPSRRGSASAARRLSASSTVCHGQTLPPAHAVMRHGGVTVDCRRATAGPRARAPRSAAVRRAEAVLGLDRDRRAPRRRESCRRPRSRTRRAAGDRSSAAARRRRRARRRVARSACSTVSTRCRVDGVHQPAVDLPGGVLRARPGSPP